MQRRSSAAHHAEWLSLIDVTGPFLSIPVLTAAEQISLGAAAAAPLLALARGTARLLADLAALAPAGLEALSEGLRQDGTMGLAALVLLVPIGLGLYRVLARVPSRR